MSTKEVATTHPVTHLDADTTFQADEEDSILDCGLEQDVDMAYGCRAGTCGACAVEVVEGKDCLDARDPIEQNTADRYDLPEGVRLSCRLRAKGALTIKNY